MATQTDYTDPVQVMRSLTRIHFATQQRQQEAEIRDRAQAADDAEHDRLVKVARLVLEDGEGLESSAYVQGYGQVDAMVVRHGDDVLVVEKGLYTLLPTITAEQVAAALDDARPLLDDGDAIYNAILDAFEIDGEPCKCGGDHCCLSTTDGRKFHLPNGVPTTVFPASVPGLGLDGGEGPVS